MSKPRISRLSVWSGVAALACLAASAAFSAEGLKLSGDEEVPPVKTSATGAGSISVSAEGQVSGSVTTTGLAGTMAHIHMAPKGKNGPVIVPLTKSADGAMWSVPPGTKLTADQLAAYKSGELYVNVHTEANKGGEVRAQLKP
ncbi:CHRD domain-containing protein [Ideonella sp.]|uniref:CHRD domain-containing protein n=1 Tax=Ideonella sp. TaxID=1929293 RepID=UPI002B461C88|nr:CHRD domain-containing protein [Ideonella sp.]HJV67657.1 CHRD domain-containing protein [Ideonella sp.]